MIGTFASWAWVDRLDGLRHHAIVGRHHEDHDVRHRSAVGAHLGERLVPRGVDEDDALAVPRNVVGPDRLRDAARLARRDIRRPDGVQQGCLAVVDMSHDRDDRRPDLQVRGGFVFAGDDDRLLLERQLGGRGAEVGGDLLDALELQRLVDGGELALLDEGLDDLAGLDAELLGEFLDGGPVRSEDLGVRSLLRFDLALALQDLLLGESL